MSLRHLTSLSAVRIVVLSVRALLLILCTVVGFCADAADLARVIPRDCRQLVFVVAPDWESARGELRRYTRSAAEEPWQMNGSPCEVLLGEQGLAWGVGISAPPTDGTRIKHEGDRCAPAGVFALPRAFGHVDRALKLPYLQLSAGVEAVDDPASRFYNQIVQRADIAQPDWRSAERMSELRDYDLGVVIAHNPRNTPRAGSCIFLHLWRGERAGTAGCTALPEPQLRELVAWLDARLHPVLVQLPRSEVPVPFP